MPRDGLINAEMVAGEDITFSRPIFDDDDKNIILMSPGNILYYNVETTTESLRACIGREKLQTDERIVASDKLSPYLYVFTNRGSLFKWDLELLDWNNQLHLPLDNNQTLVSCRMFSKRQYIYSVRDDLTDRVNLYISMSRSERERPRQKELIGEIYTGNQTSFDIGKLGSQQGFVYINNSYIHFNPLSVGAKWIPDVTKQRIDKESFTCVRANQKQSLVAAGDTLGRIYLYSGHLLSGKINRTKLHWHSLAVNDLCFSSTGSTLFSVGGESGCVVIWDVSPSNIGQKKVIARLGMPIQYLNCGHRLNNLALSLEDNEVQFMDTTYQTKKLKTITRNTSKLYRLNDPKSLRLYNDQAISLKSIGLLWHSKTDAVVLNSKPGYLQFYSLKQKAKLNDLNFLKTNILSLEKDANVKPSEITKAALTSDGDWLAFYETQESSNLFPIVKLHIWQLSPITNRWCWIQTADRIHSSTNIVDLKFSPDGQYLISVSDDGSFQLLYKVSMDIKDIGKANKKQMYAKGYIGRISQGSPALVTVSRDSSVLAISLKNNTTLIWMIVDPFKLVYECQLNQLETESDKSISQTGEAQAESDVIGLQFGYHTPSESVAPLCEIRSSTIRIWNLLNPEEVSSFPTSPAYREEDSSSYEFTSAAFDIQKPLDYFAVSTKCNLILLFKLEVPQSLSELKPLIVVNARPALSDLFSATFFTSMCFQENPVIELDEKSHQNQDIIKVLNRLCLMNNRQELVGITDRWTLDRQVAKNSCNLIQSTEPHELETYLTKSVAEYVKETSEVTELERQDGSSISEKQKRIRRRLEVQKMLKDLLMRKPSHTLPRMEVLGPMILDKLI